MKIVEIEGHNHSIQLPITNEEYDLLLKFSEQHSELQRQDLNEREIVIANQLVNKDVLYRKNQNGRITYYKKIS